MNFDEESRFKNKEIKTKLFKIKEFKKIITVFFFLRNTKENKKNKNKIKKMYFFNYFVLCFYINYFNIFFPLCYYYWGEGG